MSSVLTVPVESWFREEREQGMKAGAGGSAQGMFACVSAHTFLCEQLMGGTDRGRDKTKWFGW